MQRSYARLKEDIVEVGRRIYNLGFVAANDGNISVRVGDDEILTTPTGVSKGFMTPDMIIRVDMAGNKLEGELKPSSELKLHLEVYKQRPDVRAVLHAHPPVATAFCGGGDTPGQAGPAGDRHLPGENPHRQICHAVHRGVAGKRPAVPGRS